MSLQKLSNIIIIRKQAKPSLRLLPEKEPREISFPKGEISTFIDFITKFQYDLLRMQFLKVVINLKKKQKQRLKVIMSKNQSLAD